MFDNGTNYSSAFLVQVCFYISEAYSDPSQSSKMELSEKMFPS